MAAPSITGRRDSAPMRNSDPPEDSENVDAQVGSSDLTSGPTSGIQCDTGGTLTMVFVSGRTDTLTLLSGVQYGMKVKRITVNSGTVGIHALR